jgi:hypothetical protein
MTNYLVSLEEFLQHGRYSGIAVDVVNRRQHEGRGGLQMDLGRLGSLEWNHAEGVGNEGMDFSSRSPPDPVITDTQPAWEKE